MRKASKFLTLTGWLIACLLVHLYSLNEARVETGYSSVFFPSLASLLRRVTGFIPVSLGDILYGSVVIWLIVRLFRKAKAWFKKEPREKGPSGTGFWYRLLVRLCLVYIVFNLFWGINYNRQGIGHQLSLPVHDYTLDELKTINCLLLDKINRDKLLAIRENKTPGSSEAVFREVRLSYEKVRTEYPFLNYRPVSLKSSLWGWLGNYTGFTGYYNPFTGEAQVNTTVPRFLQPFIGCHEVAHQLGYAKENEANFVGFLAARASDNPAVRYSAYLDLFTYANRSLYSLDSSTAKLCRKELSEPVRKDIDEWIAFNRRHQSIVEPLIRWAYGKYLESNKQPKGIFSYDEVTAFLIAYYRKTGHI